MERREFLYLLWKAGLSTALGGATWFTLRRADDISYGVSTGRLDEATRFIVGKRPTWGKIRVNRPFSLAEMRESGTRAREERYLDILEKTFNFPESLFAPVDVAFQLRCGGNFENTFRVADPAAIIRYGLILQGILSGKSASLHIDDRTPSGCLWQLYRYLTELASYGIPAEKRAEYVRTGRSISEIGSNLITSLWKQKQNQLPDDDGRWVLAVSWLPILGAAEAQIQQGQPIGLARWVEEGYVGKVTSI